MTFGNLYFDHRGRILKEGVRALVIEGQNASWKMSKSRSGNYILATKTMGHRRYQQIKTELLKHH